MTARGGALSPPDAPKRRRLKWTEDDDNQLRWLWGEWSIPEIARRLERTPCGIIVRARALNLPSLKQGKPGLKDLADRLGYHSFTVRTLAERAGVPLSRRRLPSTAYEKTKTKGRRFGFEDEDIDAILEELEASPNREVIRRSRQGEWSTGTKPDACLDCARTDRPHLARGLCGACYKTRKRRGLGFEDVPPVKRGTLTKKETR